MPVRSAGILPFRRREGGLEVLLGHMGGPFWAAKDARAWSVVKGLVEEGEGDLAAALREYAEETGSALPAAVAAGCRPLGEFRQPSGKRIVVFAVELDEVPPLRAGGAGSTFELEWPPRSGRTQSFPEIDRLEWFGREAAAEKMVKGQLPILDALA
ncbi:NUDIX domain-containing protein [Herbiconiux moechotypicola]|uniref:NUDIX domain-containing protein n=1 Tax=Herbiconiux moechotypicola TaxID=637393 RepID=A0ABN3DXC7_9MICO|nr:NUDIX domain-containing protein [Herbiconiux moechotypicola]MCS5730798.1 NUDIX domain-containing protein [Herbiconiux moechotypicola]